MFQWCIGRSGKCDTACDIDERFSGVFSDLVGATKEARNEFHWCVWRSGRCDVSAALSSALTEAQFHWCVWRSGRCDYQRSPD
jgi:hypothetical protein